MNGRFPLASTAALIADPGRAAMLLALLDGRALPAGELAHAGNVSAQSASMHLAQLLDGGFVKAAQQGRHRYYRIASPEVAHAIEALGVISTPGKQRNIGPNDAIRQARTCYDHLAGKLAVRLAEAFESSGLLIRGKPPEYLLTTRGEEFFTGWGIDVEKLRVMRRSFARSCVDWTERRYHVAGALGAAIYQKLLTSQWIARDRKSRIIRVTANGSHHLNTLLESLEASADS